MIKLFISGFPLEMDEMAMARLVSPHGDIGTMKIVRDKKTRVCKGYAFLEMVDEEAALAVIAALHRYPSGNRLLTVKLADQLQIPAACYEKEGNSGIQLRKKRPRRPIS